MLKYVPMKRLSASLKTDAILYREAVPFRHLVIDDFLPREFQREFAGTFPNLAWSGWHRGRGDEDPYQPRKKGCSNLEVIPEPFDRLLYELNSGPFLLWLEKLTEIDVLLSDPQLEGGGLHASGPGGKLMPHTDFHYGRSDRLFRRLNLLVYFNEDWRPENNGALELWDQKRDVIAREVQPVLGRAVLFQTDADSMHGFSKPIAHRVRNSLALYYYSVTPPPRFSGDHATHWRKASAPGSQSTVARFLRGTALFSSKATGRLAQELMRLSQQMESMAGKVAK